MYFRWRTPSCKLVSVYHSKNRRGRHKIDLLRLKDNQNSHFCLIKKLSNYIRFPTRSRLKLDRGLKSRIFRNCFQPILRKNFKKHVSFCESNAPLEIRMPLESPTIEFVNWEKTQKCPFVVSADLEAINVASAQFPQTICWTREIERQYAASFGAVLVESRSWLKFAYISMRFWRKLIFTTTVDLIQLSTWFCST